MNFAVYSKDGCPFCTRVTEVLKLARFNFVEYKLDQHFSRKAFYDEFGEPWTRSDFVAPKLFPEYPEIF